MRDASSERTADYEINPLFLRRWSPRAMSGERIEDSELMRLFEAARWAPSSYNEQEWRFVYAARDTPHWQSLFDLLVEANQSWCKSASHLILIASRKKFSKNDKPNGVHSFDTGAAFQNLALQGADMGLVIHAMAGFDSEKARKDLGIPEVYAIDAMVAVGKSGSVADLPENFQELEKPSGRNKVEEFVSEGKFEFS